MTDDKVVIENLSIQYAAVSTVLETDREIWLTNGSLIEAVWASMLAYVLPNGTQKLYFRYGFIKSP